MRKIEGCGSRAFCQKRYPITAVFPQSSLEPLTGTPLSSFSPLSVFLFRLYFLGFNFFPQCGVVYSVHLSVVSCAFVQRCCCFIPVCFGIKTHRIVDNFFSSLFNTGRFLVIVDTSPKYRYQFITQMFVSSQEHYHSGVWLVHREGDPVTYTTQMGSPHNTPKREYLPKDHRPTWGSTAKLSYKIRAKKIVQRPKTSTHVCGQKLAQHILSQV